MNVAQILKAPPGEILLATQPSRSTNRADGMFDLAEAFQFFIDSRLSSLLRQTDEIGVDDALDDILSDFKEVQVPCPSGTARAL